MNDRYVIGRSQEELDQQRRRRRRNWLIALILFIIALLVLWFVVIKPRLKAHTTIKQAPGKTTAINYNTQTKHYDEGDFGIDLPIAWLPKAWPKDNPYKAFEWQNGPQITDGQTITVYEDTIPTNFAVNRILILEGGDAKPTVDGVASDNCSKYTIGTNGAPNQVGAPAKWQNVPFLCDQQNQQRDVVGTSSTEAVNTVTLKGAVAGSHKFFFTMTNANNTNPDYTTFYNVLNSVEMQ